MMNSTHSQEIRQGADSIAEGLEREIREGRLAEGDRLPAIRSLAEDLDVSPATVASAYRRLRARGLVAATRRGTVVAPTPDLPVRSSAPHRRIGRDLSDSNPDLRLLPDLGPIDPGDDPLLYGEAQNLDALIEAGGAAFADDGVPPHHIAVVGGSHDGVERALGAHLLPGDAVAVEDPGYVGTHDLVRAMGLTAMPIPIDEAGIDPESLERSLRGGVRSVVITNRAQNPTGAAVTPERAHRLAEVLDRYESVLVIEDDHAGPVAGAPFATTVRADRERWVVVRSFGKYLQPDLRVALMAGDTLTIGRVESRQIVGTGWVSRLLQRLAVRGLTDPRCRAALAEAEAVYADRRGTLIGALADRGIAATGRSGLNVWIPVARETEVWASLLEAGWVVAPGERFRVESDPGIRITVSSLDADEIDPLADAVAAAISASTGHRDI